MYEKKDEKTLSRKRNKQARNYILSFAPCLAIYVGIVPKCGLKRRLLINVVIFVKKETLTLGGRSIVLMEHDE